MTENHSYSVQGYNLLTLLKRLEAATSRLEDVTIYQEQWAAEQEEQGSVPPGLTTSISTPVTAKDLKNVKAISEVVKSDGSDEDGDGDGDGEIGSIKAFDSLIEKFIEPYVRLSLEIDSNLGEQATKFKEAILKERQVLKSASKSSKLKVEDEKFQQMIVIPINELIMKVIAVKDENRDSKYFNLLNAVAEGIAVLGWIVVEKPVSYIPDFKESSQFWTNRVLKEIKGKGEEEEVIGKWIKAYLSIFDELKKYVGEYHSGGITWGTHGDFILNENDTSTSTSTATSTCGSSGNGSDTSTSCPPPPPPPPPPADLFADAIDTKGENKPTEVGMGAVFAELNQGEGITRGLKKVDKSEMTHKNPELRKKSVPMPPKKPKKLSTTSTTSTTSTMSTSRESDAVKKKVLPMQFELVDNKWMAVNINGGGLRTIDARMGQSVYIGNCSDIVIQITGKVNAVSIMGCSSVGVVVDRAVASVEFTKCDKCELQILGDVPVVAVDGCNGINLYLARTALGVQVYSSASSALNINVPTSDGDGGDGDRDGGDLKELAVPEQFVTRLEGTRLVTEAVVHG